MRQLLTDRGAADYRAEAYGQTVADGIVGHEFYRLAHARSVAV